MDTDDRLEVAEGEQLIAELSSISEDRLKELALLACAQAADKNGLSVTIKEGSARVSVDLNTFEHEEPDSFALFFHGVTLTLLRQTGCKLQFYIEDGEVVVGQHSFLSLDWHRDGLDRSTPNAAYNELFPSDFALHEELRVTVTLEPILGDSTAFRIISEAIAELRVEGESVVEASKKRKAETNGKAKAKAKKGRSDTGVDDGAGDEEEENWEDDSADSADSDDDVDGEKMFVDNSVGDGKWQKNQSTCFVFFSFSFFAHRFGGGWCLVFGV